MNRGLSNRGGWVSQVLYTLSLISLGMGLFLIGWAVWPAPFDGVQIPVSKGILPGAADGSDYASLADYTLSISWPRWLRVGDEGEIQLTLSESEPNHDGVGEGQVQIVMGEPLMKGLTLSPPAATQGSLTPGSDLSMTWDVSTDQPGEYPGKVMVSFGFYDEISDEFDIVPVAVVDSLTIVTGLWGMGAGLAIWIGFVGMMLWGVMFLLGRMAQARDRKLRM